jgi:hypothetical protein
MTDQPISFDDAHAPATSVPCSRCERPLTEYWTLDGAVLCESCAETLKEERTSSEGAAGRVGKAFAFGLGGMLVGAGVWYGVAKITDYEIGIIAILLGWLVGKGIYAGSGRRGGIGYQVMAVLVTYFGIGCATLPFAMEEFAKQDVAVVDSAAAPAADSTPIAAMSDSQLDQEMRRLDSAIAAGKSLEEDAAPTAVAFGVGLLALVALTLSLPVLVVMGGGSVISVIIYGIALFEAWKLTKGTVPEISGPHPVGGAPS